MIKMIAIGKLFGDGEASYPEKYALIKRGKEIKDDEMMNMVELSSLELILIKRPDARATRVAKIENLEREIHMLREQLAQKERELSELKRE